MRTNIVIDDRLMDEALRATGLKTKREAVELALQLGDHLGEGLGGAGRRRDHVLSGGARAAEVAFAVRDVEHGLVVRVRVHRGHEALLDAERLVQDLGDGGEAVGRARAVREQVCFEVS